MQCGRVNLILIITHFINHPDSSQFTPIIIRLSVTSHFLYVFVLFMISFYICVPLLFSITLIIVGAKCNTRKLHLQLPLCLYRFSTCELFYCASVIKQSPSLNILCNLVECCFLARHVQVMIILSYSRYTLYINSVYTQVHFSFQNHFMSISIKNHCHLLFHINHKPI